MIPNKSETRPDH